MWEGGRGGQPSTTNSITTSAIGGGAFPSPRTPSPIASPPLLLAMESYDPPPSTINSITTTAIGGGVLPSPTLIRVFMEKGRSLMTAREGAGTATQH